MVRVSYSHRLVVDYEFIKWLSKSDKKTFLISKMLRLNINSLEHPKQNILVSERDFKKLCEEKIIKDKDIIKGCITPWNIKDKLDEKIDMPKIPEEFERLIIGVLSTREKPFQTMLITTKASKQEYNAKYAEFLNKIRKFDIKDETEGIIVITDLYKQYFIERELKR
jgi:hypothetical protein